MKKLMKKMEDLMVAVTFAEAGEYEEANRYAEQASEQQQQAEKVSPDFKKAGLEKAAE